MIGTAIAATVGLLALAGIGYVLYAIDAEDMLTFGGLATPFTAILVLALVAIFAFALAFAVPGRAHDFYDPWCCSGQDCQPAPPNSVHWSPAGWVVPQFNVTIPFDSKRVRHSPADVPGFHLCEWPKGKLRCLYVPELQG